MATDINERTSSKDRGDNRQQKQSMSLSGTTLKVYRYLYRTGRPVGIRDIQRGIRLSSPSVAEYHVKKLLAMGIVKEEEKEDGNSSPTSSSRFLVDRRVFESMIRIRRTIIPLQIGYSVFFGTGFLLMLLPFRSRILSGGYIFALAMIACACLIFGYQAFRALQSNKI